MLVIVSSSYLLIFFFKQKTAYEMRISDWSSDVCSSDLVVGSIPIASTIARPVVHPWKIEIRELAPGRRLVLFDSVDRNFSGERLLASRAARLRLGVCREA